MPNILKSTLGAAAPAGAGALSARHPGRAGGAAVGRDRRDHAAAARADAVVGRPLAGAGVFGSQCARGGADRQFAGRFAGAVASDLPPHPAIGRGEEAAGHRLCRGRRRLRRLHARLRRRRDYLRPVFHRRLDRRGRRLVRVSEVDGKARRRAQALYRRRAQGDARPVPAGKAGGRETHQGDPEGHPRAVHRPGQGTPRNAD